MVGNGTHHKFSPICKPMELDTANPMFEAHVTELSEPPPFKQAIDEYWQFTPFQEPQQCAPDSCNMFKPEQLDIPKPHPPWGLNFSKI